MREAIQTSVLLLENDIKCNRADFIDRRNIGFILKWNRGFS